MKRAFTDTLTIHLFAALHVVIVVICFSLDINDSLLLTLATMLLTLIICIEQRMKVEFTAAAVVLVNIFGFLMGTGLAEAMKSLIGADADVSYGLSLLSHCFSTFVTTELLGWSTFGITELCRRKSSLTEEKKSSSGMKWLAGAAAVIFIIRIIISLIFSGGLLATYDLTLAATRFLRNSGTWIIMIALTVVYIRNMSRWLGNSSLRLRILTSTLFIILLSLTGTLFVAYDFPLFNGKGLTGEEFIQTLAFAFVMELIVFMVTNLILYALAARKEMNRERNRADQAQYQYFKIKSQVNPHFLFNSLNVLDCLVLDEKTEEASTYIHKLAGLYRYMIHDEEVTLVTLREELEFVVKYIDLLKVRFQEGLAVIIDIPEEAMGHQVVPCSIQLLIENATKHNTVSPSNPLKVKISLCDGADGNNAMVTVRNNIIPKLTKSPSTGLGLKYIRQQYLELAGKGIEVKEDEGEYVVRLPLI